MKWEMRTMATAESIAIFSIVSLNSTSLDGLNTSSEFRISLDFSEGRFSSTMLEEVTDFAKLTFPGEIKVDMNPLSLSDWIYFEIGDIRDICQCIEVEELFDEKFTIHIEKEPTMVESYETPHKPRPTFCKGVIEVAFPNGKYYLAVS